MKMIKPFSLFIGLRYSNLRKRDHFISFISLVSIIGIALGIMVMITVMSVMNGFTKEIRTRILSVTPHLTVSSFTRELKDWQTLQTRIQSHPEYAASTPFIDGQGMFIEGQEMIGVGIRGILPDQIEQVFPLHSAMIAGKASDLKPGEFGMVLGVGLANKLGVQLGDKLTLVIPEVTYTIAGATPRFKTVKVVGVFEVGYLYDQNYAFLHMADAAKLFKMHEGVSGLQLKLKDPFQSPAVVRDLNQSLSQLYHNQYVIIDWTMANGTYFSAVKTEKTMMFFTLLLILTIAVFNLVSTLVMVVTDKKGDIALLRTLGASTQKIMAIFVAQGAMIGGIGTLLGIILGTALSLNVTRIVGAIEKLFNVQFLSKEVYFISFLPSDLHRSDVILISSCAFGLSLVATLWPAWRAAQIEPAKALRQDS